MLCAYSQNTLKKTNLQGKLLKNTAWNMFTMLLVNVVFLQKRHLKTAIFTTLSLFVLPDFHTSCLSTRLGRRGVRFFHARHTPQ